MLIYKEGEAYKVTVFKRSGLRRKLKPETYLLQDVRRLVIGHVDAETRVHEQVAVLLLQDVYKRQMRLRVFGGKPSR